MAMACLRLFTRPPLPLPERSVPRFLLRMALATVLLAPLLYLRRDADFRAAIVLLLGIRVRQREKSLRTNKKTSTRANFQLCWTRDGAYFGIVVFIDARVERPRANGIFGTQAEAEGDGIAGSKGIEI